MKKLTIVTLLAICIVMTTVVFVSADTPAPQNDYIIEVGEGEYLFVMLGPSDFGWGSSPDEQIRKVYNQSGLYRKNDPTQPLWTVDWYAHTVFVMDDGKHLARLGPWPGKWNFRDTAFMFYEEGVLIQDYEVRDLVLFPILLPQTVSHYTWLSSIDFDQETGMLFVESITNERYLFDVATGEVLEGMLASRIRALGIWGTTGLFCVMLAPFFYSRKEKMGV